MGSAALDICHVAHGFCDAFWHIGLHVWDFCAAQLIVTEAGGVAISTEGTDLYLEMLNDANNPRGEVESQLRSVPYPMLLYKKRKNSYVYFETCFSSTACDQWVQPHAACAQWQLATVTPTSRQASTAGISQLER